MSTLKCNIKMLQYNVNYFLWLQITNYAFHAILTY